MASARARKTIKLQRIREQSRRFMEIVRARHPVSKSEGGFLIPPDVQMEILQQVEHNRIRKWILKNRPTVDNWLSDRHSHIGIRRLAKRRIFPRWFIARFRNEEARERQRILAAERWLTEGVQ